MEREVIKEIPFPFPWQSLPLKASKYLPGSPQFIWAETGLTSFPIFPSHLHLSPQSQFAQASESKICLKRKRMELQVGHKSTCSPPRGSPHFLRAILIPPAEGVIHTRLHRSSGSCQTQSQPLFTDAKYNQNWCDPTQLMAPWRIWAVVWFCAWATESWNSLFTTETGRSEVWQRGVQRVCSVDVALPGFWVVDTGYS